jgi:hypothetical protein
MAVVLIQVVLTGLQLNQSATSQILRREYRSKDKQYNKYYNTTEPRQFAADRAVGNMSEHVRTSWHSCSAVCF